MKKTKQKEIIMWYNLLDIVVVAICVLVCRNAVGSGTAMESFLFHENSYI